MANKTTTRLSILCSCLLLTACSSFVADLQMQKGFFVTQVKAPLTTQIPKKEIGVPQRKTYSTKFLWIPFITPSVSVTDYGTKLNGNYADYEYFSLLFGIYQSVDIITYK